MRCLQILANGSLRITDRDRPELGPRDCLVRPERIGICHSDIELSRGNFITPVSYPITPGHEWTGIVSAIGHQVTGVDVGDRVVGICRTGENDYFGLNQDGAAAEEIAVKSDWLHVVPATLSQASAALIEPFTVAFYALDVHGGVKPSDTVVVLGAGPIGLCAVAAVAALGGTAIAVDPNDDRRRLAHRVGASSTVGPTDDPVSEVLSVTGGRGADLVVEASGVASALAMSLELVRQFGRLTFVGFNFDETITLKMGLIQSKDLTIRGITGSGDVWARAINLLADRDVDLTPLVTSVFSMDRADDAFAAASNGQQVKVHINIQQASWPASPPCGR